MRRKSSWTLLPATKDVPGVRPIGVDALGTTELIPVGSIRPSSSSDVSGKHVRPCLPERQTLLRDEHLEKVIA
jgi:hypothetical protein